MIRSSKILIAAALAAGTVAAQAADFSAGASLGGSNWRVDDQPGYSIDKTDVGGKLFGTVDFTPNLGLEFGYAYLGKAKLSAPGVSGDVKGQGVYLDVVGTLPVTNEWGVFAKLGAFHGEAKVSASVAGLGNGSDSDTGTDLHWGIGGTYAINRNVTMRAEWERYRFNVFNDKGDTDLLSVGFTYKF